MDSSDSLKIDENLAWLLAAYDQSIEGGDPGPATIHAPIPAELSADLPLSATTERPVTPLRPDAPNEGSLGEVLPDSRNGRARPLSGVTPVPNGGPHRIGRFELRRQLGKGGCGIVFLAYDPKLEREVALKIPRPEMLLNSDAKRRLMREAQAAAEFDHPNLVPVFDTGEIGPLCFIATAFCPGQTLAEWLDRQAFPVPVRQAARLVATVAEAVQHAHDRGVLHRDLKPNNVILQEMKVEENDEPPPGSVQLRGDHFVPRLVDFGLAKLAERGGPSETATRQILGTPKYMAPEQAQARREDIGPPADVYGLGIILYEMLAGRAPYDGATDVEVLRQAIEGKPLPPRKLRPDIPRDLEAICLKAMACNTAERYRSAIELADDLRRFLDGRPTIARPLAWPGRAWRWLRRNDQMVAIVTLAITVVFVTGLGSWNWYESWKLRKANANALDEQAKRNRTEQEREYARHMRDAFLAWRGGNDASASLEDARKASAALMEQPDFTHAYLRRLVQSGQLTIVCPAGAVTALAASPDGARLASGHADGSIAVWDRATGKQLGAVKAYHSQVTHVAFALSGAMLVTVGKQADSSSTMLGWEVGKGGAIEPARGDRRELGKDIHCCAVSPDGRTVFAGGRNGLLMKRDLNDAAPVVARKGEPGKPSVTAIAVARDGKRVITADSAGTVLCWTAGLQRDEVREYEFNAEVSALAANYAGLPAVGFGAGDVWLVEPMCHPLIFPAGGRVHWIAATDKTFALSGVPGRVQLGRSELATGDLGAVRAGAFSVDGKTLFTGSDDGIIRLWDAATEARDRAASFAGRVAAVGVSGDGRQFVVADEHHVKRHNGSEGQFVEGGPRPLVALRVQDNGTIRGVAFEKSVFVVHDLSGNTSAELLRARMPDDRLATAAALTPDGGRLAVGDDAGRVTIWSVADRTALGTFDTGLRRPVRRLAFSDDGRHLAAPTAAGVGVWTVGVAEAVATIDADDQAVFRVLVGERIATAGRDGVVRVWSFAGKEQAALYGHVGRVTALGVSPDGRTLLSGGATGEVKFWDLRTGQELLGLRRHSTAVTVIEFASSSRLLVTAGDGQLAVWDARE